MIFKNPIKDYTFTIMVKNKSLTDIRIFRVKKFIYLKIIRY